MRSKPVRWLMAAALLSTISIPGWAQPELVGGEFQVNQNNKPRQLQPQVAFSPAGSSLIVWENDRYGILGRAYDRDGNALTGELVLVANQNLPGIPAQGNVVVRKEPALVHLNGNEFLVLWTEERDFLVLDHFYERRVILDQDVYGQRFSLDGTPQGARFRVNATTDHHQRRPEAAVLPAGLVVTWENAWKSDERNSHAIYGRLFTQRGAAEGAEFRVDAGQFPEVWNPEVAANAAGDFMIVWESGVLTAPNIYARLYERDGTPAGPRFVANPSTAGRQRRPAVISTRGGDFLVAWQSYIKGTPIHGIVGQFYSPAGQRIGSEIQISKSAGEVQISPALARLPSGDIVVAWMDWVGTYPIGVWAVEMDENGPLGDEVLVSQERLYPQYQISVAASASGDIVATWEARLKRERAIAARRLLAD